MLLLLQPWMDQQCVISFFFFPFISYPLSRPANRNGFDTGVGSFQEYYVNGPLEDYSSSTIAWIPSLQVFFLFGLGPIVGRLYDLYGPTPLIIGGSLLHVFGLMMASLAKTYYQFLLTQGVCSAIGVAFLYSPGMFQQFHPLAPNISIRYLRLNFLCTPF